MLLSFAEFSLASLFTQARVQEQKIWNQMFISWDCLVVAVHNLLQKLRLENKYDIPNTNVDKF